MMKQFQFVVAALLAMVLMACGNSNTAKQAESSLPADSPYVVATDSRLLDTGEALIIPDLGEPAPDFEYTLRDGSVVKLSDLRGKKVVINFWATWCEPCRDEMPDLQQLADEYGDSLVVLGVNRMQDLTTIEQFVSAEVPVTFPLVTNPDGSISNRYVARNLPTSFFVNTDGTIGGRRIGVMDYDYIKDQIENLQ
jgi:thiol-disulfide isomerase/thioredoxin